MNTHSYNQCDIQYNSSSVPMNFKKSKRHVSFISILLFGYVTTTRSRGQGRRLLHHRKRQRQYLLPKFPDPAGLSLFCFSVFSKPKRAKSTLLPTTRIILQGKHGTCFFLIKIECSFLIESFKIQKTNIFCVFIPEKMQEQSKDPVRSNTRPEIRHTCI